MMNDLDCFQILYLYLFLSHLEDYILSKSGN